MLRRYFTALAVSAALAAPAFAGDTLRIGMVAPFSGPASPGAQAMLKSYQFVLKDINEAGGIEIDGQKKKIELVLADSQSKPDVGVSAAQRLLTRDNVDLILGDMVHSDVTLALMDTVSSFPKIMMTGGGVSADIAKRIAASPEKYKNIWKFNYSSDAYGTTVTGVIETILGKSPETPKRVAIIAEDAGFTRPILDALTPLLKQNGLEVVATEMAPIGTTDFYPRIAKIRQVSPGFLISIFTAPNSAVSLTKQIAEQNLRAVHVGVVGPAQDGFIAATGAAAEGTVFAPMVFDPLHNPEHKAFADKLSAFIGGGEIGLDYITGYTNACVLMDVLKRAGSTTPEAMNKAFLTTEVKCLYSEWVFDPVLHQPKFGHGFFSLPAGQIQGGPRYAIWQERQATTSYKPRP